MPVGVVVAPAEAGAPSLVLRRQAQGKNNSPRRAGRSYKPCPRLPGRRIRLQSLVDPSRTCLMKCKGWTCTGCGPWLKDRFIKVASAEAKRVFGRQCRFLTLTLGPESRQLERKDQFKLMSRAWARMVKRIERRPTHTRKNGADVFRKLSAIWVREVHQDGTPHLHVLVDRYLPQEWVSQAWKKCGGGPVVDIRRVKIGSVVAYVTKYLAKSLSKPVEGHHGSDGLKGIRRYGATGKAKLKGVYPVKRGDDPWGIFWKPGLNQPMDWTLAGRYEVPMVMAWVMANFGENGIDHEFRKKVEASMADRAQRLRAMQARATTLPAQPSGRLGDPYGESEISASSVELAKRLWGAGAA